MALVKRKWRNLRISPHSLCTPSLGWQECAMAARRRRASPWLGLSEWRETAVSASARPGIGAALDEGQVDGQPGVFSRVARRPLVAQVG